MENLDRTLRRASKDRLIALLEDLCGVVPASRLLDVLGRHVDLDALTAPPETASDEPRSVLRDVGKFHASSLAGDYYDPFPVNSRNFMVRSEGAVDWEQECERLLQRCRRASRHGHHAQARECFDLLFDLLGRMDHGDEIVFFADEGGSWQVADVEPIWPDYFRSLAAVTAPEEYVKGVETLCEQRLGSRPERLLAAARKAADPGQQRLLRARMGHHEARGPPGMTRQGMRLYRGPKEPYRSSDVPSNRLHGTDFTDCPDAALAYASSRRGVVLVLDVPADAETFVTEEAWLGHEARRLMVWGTFDCWVVAVIAAKDHRAEVRGKGVCRLRPVDKRVLLRQAIARRLGDVAEPWSGAARWDRRGAHS